MQVTIQQQQAQLQQANAQHMALLRRLDALEQEAGRQGAALATAAKAHAEDAARQHQLEMQDKERMLQAAQRCPSAVIRHVAAC